jgi:hypothetical protein
MILRRIFEVFLVVAALALPSLSFLDDARASSSREGNLLKPMLLVLEKSGISASLVFSARCQAPTPPEFPPLRVLTSTDGPPLSALRKMLADDKHIRLTQDVDGGMIRMLEIDVPDDILNVRISHISFNGVYSRGTYGVDNPNEALHIILGSPEVESFITANHLDLVFNDSGIGGGGERPPDQPHLSGSFDNLTIQQALDRVLKTFPGIWVYQNCPQDEARERRVYFRFFYLREWGADKVVEF